MVQKASAAQGSPNRLRRQSERDVEALLGSSRPLQAYPDRVAPLCPPRHSRGLCYAIRLPANDVLERQIEDLLTRPGPTESRASGPLPQLSLSGRPWDRPRRVIAKIEHHLGELFPRVGFIITTLTGTNRAIVRFYNQRGTAEQWIKQGKTPPIRPGSPATSSGPTRSGCSFSVIAYNLGNLLRRLVRPAAIQDWVAHEYPATAAQDRRAADPPRAVLTLRLAESYLTGALFRQILQRIERLAWPPT